MFQALVTSSIQFYRIEIIYQINRGLIAARGPECGLSLLPDLAMMNDFTYERSGAGVSVV
jgi:hypothetical protein